MKTLETKTLVRKKAGIAKNTGANQSFFVQKAEEVAIFVGKISLPQTLVETKK
jgi:hypothetical protein